MTTTRTATAWSPNASVNHGSFAALPDAFFDTIEGDGNGNDGADGRAYAAASASIRPDRRRVPNGVVTSKFVVGVFTLAFALAPALLAAGIAVYKRLHQFVPPPIISYELLWQAANASSSYGNLYVSADGRYIVDATTGVATVWAVDGLSASNPVTSPSTTATCAGLPGNVGSKFFADGSFFWLTYNGSDPVLQACYVLPGGAGGLATGSVVSIALGGVVGAGTERLNLTAAFDSGGTAAGNTSVVLASAAALYQVVTVPASSRAALVDTFARPSSSPAEVSIVALSAVNVAGYGVMVARACMDTQTTCVLESYFFVPGTGRSVALNMTQPTSYTVAHWYTPALYVTASHAYVGGGAGIGVLPLINGSTSDQTYDALNGDDEHTVAIPKEQVANAFCLVGTPDSQSVVFLFDAYNDQTNKANIFFAVLDVASRSVASLWDASPFDDDFFNIDRNYAAPFRMPWGDGLLYLAYRDFNYGIDYIIPLE
ncbi:hypothetical protein HK405_007232 [Cladochytrium tenue]|nr:hypothetical protein HK405_007232 [Cladochytrium tenue]